MGGTVQTEIATCQSLASQKNFPPKKTVLKTHRMAAGYGFSSTSLLPMAIGRVLRTV